MRVLGISGSPREGQTTDRLVLEVLSGTECETEFIPLRSMHIGPCIACLGCVEDNICKVRDDMALLRPRIVAADAIVVGAPNYFGMLNAATHCFLERFYQFRHREGTAVAGKFGAVVSVGGGNTVAAGECIESFFEYNRMPCVGAVNAQGAASCFTCGHGETCRVGAVHMFFGAGTEIYEDIIPSLEKQPGKLEEARALGKKLGDKLRASRDAS